MAAWPTLPTIAHEIGVAESTARRWAAALDDLLASRARGAGQRFDPAAKEILSKAKELYGRGMSSEQVTEILHDEFRRSGHRPARPGEQTSQVLVRVQARKSETVENRKSETVDDLAQLRSEIAQLTAGMAALEAAVSKAAEDQKRDNGRFRSVLDALVDLMDVQEHHRRLADADREKRVTQGQQRVMLALQELLSSQRRR